MDHHSISGNYYFRYRNISEKDYINYALPLWIKKEILGKDLKILDFGCGFGQVLAALRKEGFNNIYGVDIEKDALDYCLHQNMRVKIIDPKQLNNPFDEKFDIILLLHVLEHIPKNEIINTLSFIKDNLLTRGGKILIAVPNAQSNTSCYWAYEDWTHSTLFTSGSIYFVAKAAGFENIEYIDIDCTLGKSKINTYITKFFLALYRLNITFWNIVTCSAYHQPSPKIFSYEIKAKIFNV